MVGEVEKEARRKQRKNSNLFRRKSSESEKHRRRTRLPPGWSGAADDAGNPGEAAAELKVNPNPSNLLDLGFLEREFLCNFFGM